MLIPVQKGKHFTRVINTFIDDTSLTFEAIGLMLVIVRKHFVSEYPKAVITLRLETVYDYAPPTAKTNIEKYVKKIMYLLREKGYARLYRIQGKSGKYMMFYDFCELAQADWINEYNYYQLPSNKSKSCPTLPMSKITGTVVYPVLTKKQALASKNKPEIEFTPTFGNQQSVTTKNATIKGIENENVMQNNRKNTQKSPTFGNQQSVTTKNTNNTPVENQANTHYETQPTFDLRRSVKPLTDLRKSNLSYINTLENSLDYIIDSLLLITLEGFDLRTSVATMGIQKAFTLCSEVVLGQQYLLIEKEEKVLEELGEKLHESEYIKTLLTFIKKIKLDAARYQPSYLRRAWADVLQSAKSENYKITLSYARNKSKSQYMKLEKEIDRLLFLIKQKELKDMAHFDQVIREILTAGYELTKYAIVLEINFTHFETIKKLIGRLGENTYQEIEDKYFAPALVTT